METTQHPKKNFPGLASLSVKLPVCLALFCIILSIANGIIGYRVFQKLYERQYRTVTEQFARTALSYIDTNRITEYARTGMSDDAWRQSDNMLEILTETADIAYIYVTIPDETYTSRVYIYDTVNSQIKKGHKYALGQVNSLQSYDADYIQNLKNVMEKGENYIRFTYNNTGGHVTTSVPVRTAGGEIVAIMSIVKPLSEVRSFKATYRNTVALSSTLITLFFVAIFVLMLLFRVVRPITVVTKETSHFAQHPGHVSKALAKIRGKNELAVLARSVEKMSADTKRYIEDLTHITAEKERIGAELNVATQIQADMLPRVFPPYENHPEIELFASMQPAKEVGGDFYDFFLADDDHFAVVVGDVSGKGVPASLFMVIAKTLIHNAAMHSLRPGDILQNINSQLCEGNDAGLFVTCWLGILTLSTGELVFCNAGHNQPIVCQNGSFRFLDTQPNLMLAAMEGMPYTEHRLTLAQGDRIFIYTDGVTEATDAGNQLYGEERLLDAISKTAGMTSREVLAEIRKDIDSFVQAAPQFDDITMLEMCIKKRP
ncbi:MAG: SpoIIE family protein phosphatase [Treponema sp.]|nr:SpoIIE family protein phosphatase [Treponema sp.]